MSDTNQISIVQVSFTYSAYDTPLFIESGENQTRRLWKSFIGRSVFIALVAGIFFVVLKGDKIRLIFFSTLLSIIINIIPIFVQAIRIFRSWKKENVEATSGLEQRINISMDYIRWETDVFQSLFQWRYFRQFSESSIAFNLFCFNGSVIYAIPKRVLNAEQQDFVRSVLRLRIVSK